MPPERGIPDPAVKQWKPLATVNDSLLGKIKYFHGFSTYSGEEGIRKPSAIFVTTDDEAYAIGYNSTDNLLALEGDEFAREVNLVEPRKMEGLSKKKIRTLTVSERFGAALTEDGGLIYWGTKMAEVPGEKRNKNDVQLPHFPQPRLKLAMIAIGGHSITCLTKSGFIRVWGCLNTPYYEFYDFEPIFLKTGTVVTTLAVGWYHGAVLDTKGKAWTFGVGRSGELGYEWSNRESLGSFPKCEKVKLPRKCKKVQCGSNSTLFLLENGEVYACGNNLQLDHLCVGKTGHIFAPVRVLLDDPITNIMAVYHFSGEKCQSRFSAATRKGEFFKWGEEKSKTVPSIVSGVSTLDEVYVNFKTPQEYGAVIGKGRDVQQDSGNPSGKTQKSNTTDSGLHKNSDSSDEGKQLPGLAASNSAKPERPPGSSSATPVTGYGSMPREPKPPPASAAAPAPAPATPAPAAPIPPAPPPPPAPRAILSKWTLFKSIEEKLAAKITRFMVFSGYDSVKGEEALGAFVVTKDDDVFSFGINTGEGLLGLGAIAHENIVEKPTRVDSLSGKNIKKIVVGMNHGAALSKNGSVFVWNKQSGPTLLNVEGENPIDIAVGSEFILVLTDWDNIFEIMEIYAEGGLIFNYDLKSNKKIIFPKDVKVKSIECGDLHGAFVSTNGDAYTFGDGVYDQLGYPPSDIGFTYEAKKVTFDYPCTRIACGVGYTAFLLNTGEVYACGAKVYDIEIGEEESIVIPQKINIPEPVSDLVSVTRCVYDGWRVTWFVAVTVTKNTYMWTDWRPKIVKDVTSVLGAIEGLAIPQSMSMVILEDQDGGEESENDIRASSFLINDGERKKNGDGRKLKEDKFGGSTFGNEGNPANDTKIGETLGETDFQKSRDAANGNDENPKNYLIGDPSYSDLLIKLSDATTRAHKVFLHSKSAFFRKAISRNYDIRELDMSAYKPKTVLAFLK